MRAVGNKPQEQQQGALAELKAERSRKEAKKQERKQDKQRKPQVPENRPSTGDGYYDVIEDGAAKGPAAEIPAGEQGGEDQSRQNVPVPRSNNDASGEGELVEEQRQSRTLPYDDPSFIAMHLMRKMEEPDLYEMLRLLNKLAQERNPAEFGKVLGQFTDEAMAQAG